ncbi:class I SAM-dependent methyltransferase [Thalassospira indica]|uniref:Class I SAM-dependent methyltransferase n=1 Tax=Thalassospira indica TaxID=1891279 RepID=A0ABN5NHN5_9PROT|nr:class I SAM-dependent methyltransferase [Thalassospira indica]AXO13641.1 class I SAM-dependent methyltransferase [Thalassospira indica]OAZ14477.1 methyltransferase [Thalassospira profundimaris]
MKSELLFRLRCPKTGQKLIYESDTGYAKTETKDIDDGWLVSEDGKHRYLVHRSIPRFVPKSNYADNFGMQWNHFAKTQLDSYSGQPISEDRFWNATGWTPDEIKGQWVLDVGAGSGRFAEIALKAGAIVVALDYSSAVDACYANLNHYPNLHVVQGDVYALPFSGESFRYVYSLGVLQHTPDVEKAFFALPPMVEDGGYLCADFYWNRFRTLMNPKYLLRPFTKRLDQKLLFGWLERNIPTLLRMSQTLGRIPLLGRFLKRLVPVVDYTGIYDLSQKQLEEWALLDTFDMLAPAYDKPQSARTITKWFKEKGLKDIEVFHWGHLVGRGKK